jgi:phage terminase small subunit
MALTGKRLKFAQEYTVDHNATQAAIRAGYSRKSAHTEGCRLLRNAEVREAVGLAQLSAAEEAGARAADVLKELMRIGFADPAQVVDADGKLKALKEMTPDVRRAIASVEIEELFDGRGENRVQIGVLHKVKFWDKPKALELIAKHLKMLTDRVEHDVSSMTLEQIIAAASKPESAG